MPIVLLNVNNEDVYKPIKEYLDEHNGESDPRKYMTPGKLAMKEIVKNKIEVCGSMNRY